MQQLLLLSSRLCVTRITINVRDKHQESLFARNGFIFDNMAYYGVDDWTRGVSWRSFMSLATWQANDRMPVKFMSPESGFVPACEEAVKQ